MKTKNRKTHQEPRCECTHQFTCGFCCRKAKPWVFTTSTGAKLWPPPVDLR